MKLYLTLFLFIFSITSYAQDDETLHQKIDSIYQNITLKGINEEKCYEIEAFLGEIKYPKYSKKLIDKIVTYSLNTKNDKQIVNSYYSLSNYYFYNSKLDSTLIIIKKMEPYFKSIKLPLLEASMLMTKGGSFSRKGNIIKANLHFLNALKLLNSIDTFSLSKKDDIKRKGKTMILNNSLAIFNKKTKHYKKSLFHYDRAYKMALKLNRNQLAGIILSNKGDLLLELKKYDDALSVLLKSKKLRNVYSLTDLNIARVLTEMNNYDKALNLFNEILPKFKNNTNYQMYTFFGRGDLFLQTEKFQKAIVDCKTAFDIAKEVKDVEYQNLASKCLSEAYSKIKNYEKAFIYQSKHKILTDSIFNTNNVEKMTQLQMQYEFDKQNELENVKTNAKEKVNKQLIYSLIIGLIGLTILLGLLYKINSNRKHNNEILAVKNKQINKALANNEVLMKETHHRVKNSLQMISSLLYLQSENIEDEKAAASVKDGQIRVKSMALIHQKLYQNDNLTGVEVTDYINDLAESIFQSHNINNNDIELIIDVDKMVLDIDTITPIGIIINELIVNALKHAFSEETKHAKINISLHKIKEELILKVEDNGKGINIEKKKEKSFGMKLIKSLSRKLKADLTIVNKNGTLVTLNIKRFNIK